MVTLGRVGSLGLLAVLCAAHGTASGAAGSAAGNADGHRQATVRAALTSAAQPAALIVPECQTAQLRGMLGMQTGGAGSVFTTVVLRNVGSQTCTVIGYPGVSLVDAAGRQIGQPATRVGGVPVQRIVLAPGGSASTIVRSLNPGVGTTNCLPPSAALRVYPPNQRIPLYITAHLSECLGRLEVRPLVAGTSGE